MRIFIIIMLFVFSLNANWETTIKVDHAELSETYVEAMAANKKAMEMCRNHIAKAQAFKDEMNDLDEDKAKLEDYLEMVKYYCSKVAGCQCKREI